MSERHEEQHRTQLGGALACGKRIKLIGAAFLLQHTERLPRPRPRGNCTGPRLPPYDNPASARAVVVCRQAVAKSIWETFKRAGFQQSNSDHHVACLRCCDTSVLLHSHGVLAPVVWVHVLRRTIRNTPSSWTNSCNALDRDSLARSTSTEDRVAGRTRSFWTCKTANTLDRSCRGALVLLGSYTPPILGHIQNVVT